MMGTLEAPMTDDKPISLTTLSFKTIVVHTVTYMVAGITAYTLADYETVYAQPPLSNFMRQTSSPWVMAGPLFQPIRGLIFALALYPLREVIFTRKNGWLILWWLLVALGILSTFGPAPGSIEGMVYTIIPPLSQLLGLWEVLAQALLLASLLFYWVNHPEKRWLSWTLGAIFFVSLALPIIGLLAGQMQ
jgi:hypothetical protein